MGVYLMGWNRNPSRGEPGHPVGWGAPATTRPADGVFPKSPPQAPDPKSDSNVTPETTEDSSTSPARGGWWDEAVNG
ncbi:hypothetical protein K2Q16_00740 [Patescibacteria group bacterium]|nr:hypothetical protein [Patescibacteria group bacterium]